MATLAESFLEDLEELDDETVNNEILDQEQVGEKSVENDDNDEILDAIELYEKNQIESAVIVSDMTKRPEFLAILMKVREFSLDTHSDDATPIIQSDEEYDLIEKCNELVIAVDKEILEIHKFIKDIYSKKFPELESIVYSPLEYIAIVQRVKNEQDLTKIDLSDLLGNTVIIAVTVAASMTTGSVLPPAELDKVLGAAEEAMQLAESRKDILLYLESRMSLLAPNLTVILGSALSARLMTHAGGLSSLARMPAQNIMLIGSSRKASLGYGTATAGVRRGIIWQCEIVQTTHLAYRNRAVKLVAGKCSIAARVDSFHQSPGGEVGLALREKIIKSLYKSQEPPPAPQKKVLPLPDEQSKTKRGGKRYRRMKEKYGLSEYRKTSNRLKFGMESEEVYGLDNESEGFGMIGISNDGSAFGKLKLQVKQQKVQIPNKRLSKGRLGGAASSMGLLQSKRKDKKLVDGISTSLGFSSLTFTPIQGLELTNPENLRDNRNSIFNNSMNMNHVGGGKSMISSSILQNNRGLNENGMIVNRIGNKGNNDANTILSSSSSSSIIDNKGGNTNIDRKSMNSNAATMMNTNVLGGNSDKYFSNLVKFIKVEKEKNNNNIN